MSIFSQWCLAEISTLGSVSPCGLDHRTVHYDSRFGLRYVDGKSDLRLCMQMLFGFTRNTTDDGFQNVTGQFPEAQVKLGKGQTHVLVSFMETEPKHTPNRSNDSVNSAA